MDPSTRIDALLSLYEEMRMRGEQVTPAELCRDDPELLPAVKQHLRRLVGMEPLLALTPPDFSFTGAVAVDSAKEAAGDEVTLRQEMRYRLVRPHARGGLGEVMLARDEQLLRDVAVKRIRMPLDASGDRLARFEREAQLTGALEHPGIVPVYGAGRDESDRPWYAMRMIQGQTLSAAIERHHADASGAADPSKGTLSLRLLMGRFVAVCNTIGFAHAQGVIHRDLKPANVMIGDFNETLVVDWGLARSSRVAEFPDAGEAAREAPRSEFETAQGVTMGTPAFMSPEQAAGQWDRVGPASDIYSLGATLYVVLTGQPPFQGSSFAEISQKIRLGELRRPRNVMPQLQPALEAICLKAMAVRIEDRYATTMAIASDIEHWLADEPVTAWREPWPIRVRRWITRHKAIAASVVSTLLAALLILSVSTWLLLRANQRERDAKSEASEQQKLAQKGFDQARQAVDDYLMQVSQSKLKSLPGAQEIRRELLTTALKYYQSFVEQRADDPTSRQRVAESCMQLGMIVADLESNQAGLQWFERAIAVRRQALDEEPTSSVARHGLVRSLLVMPRHYYAAGRVPDAIAALQEADRSILQLLAADPNDRVALENAATALADMGTLQAISGAYVEAVASCRRALTAFERLQALDPTAQAYPVHIAKICHNLGIDLTELGKHAESIAWYERSLSIRTGLLAAREKDPSLRDHRASSSSIKMETAYTHLGLASTLYLLARSSEALSHYEQAIALCRQLVEQEPKVAPFRNSLGYAIVCRADFLAFTKADPKQVYEAAMEADTLAAQVAREDPKSIVHMKQRAYSLEILAVALSRLGRHDDAAAALGSAAKLLEESVAKSPKATGDIALNQFKHQECIALSLFAARDPGGAAKALVRMRDLVPKDGFRLYRVAVLQAECHALCTDQGLRRRCALEALATLRQAIANGFDDGARLEGQTEWDSFRAQLGFPRIPLSGS